MRQVLQNLSNGQTSLAEVPRPKLPAGHLLIRTTYSVVSAGTERMLVEFGKANLIDKARQQPDKVRMVLDKVKTDGVLPTLEAVRSKLDQPLALGYSSAGTVLEVGEGVTGFAIGDRVASNGKHAEVVSVPANLCAKIPDNVADEAAAFSVIGAIALQGIRLAQPTLGESFVVTGLGLIGLITVQLLRAQGCRVLGLDYDASRLELARRFGAETVSLANGEEPLSAAQAFSRGQGIDGVLITASTKSDEPVAQAAKMCRKRGRIVLVGVTGLQLSRADFYEKELTFQVSCSYGPGRYDANYEEKGQDYPIGFVRWTEQRNFAAVLDMLASGALEVDALISHRFPLTNAGQAYALLAGGEPCLGIVLEYPAPAGMPVDELKTGTVQLIAAPAKPVAAGAPVIGFIGAGNYAGRVLIPAFKKTGAVLHSIASNNGVSGTYFGKKFGFRQTTTDTAALLADDSVDTVVIATRHDSHAGLVCDALQAGKHVFVEKPLCLTLEELARIERLQRQECLLMIGFNRRFAPQAQKIKSLLDTVQQPKSFIMTVNAGEIPPQHWTQDAAVGGGRIIGEACHFIDLLRFLVGAPVIDVQTTAIGKAAGSAVRDDKTTFTLQFADGSFGTVHYLANGHKAFPKERLEIFCAGRVLQLDNFRKLRAYGWPGFRKMNLWRQDKGQQACAAAFVNAARTGQAAPIPVADLFEVSRLSIGIAVSAGQ